MADLDDLKSALTVLPTTTLAIAAQVASAALQTVSHVTETNARRVSQQAQHCALKAAQAAELGMTQLSRTIAELVAATADQAALLTQRQASLVAAFAQEQAAKAAEAFEQLTFENNELLHSIRPNVAIIEQPSALAALPNTSNSSNARCDGDLHGLAEGEEDQHFAAACGASSSSMQLAGMALAEAEVRFLVKGMTADIFRNVERAAAAHQLEVLYKELQQSQAQLESVRNQLAAAAPCVLRSLPEGVVPQAESPAPGAVVLMLHDGQVVIDNDGEDSCGTCCAESTDANEFVLVEFGEEM